VLQANQIRLKSEQENGVGECSGQRSQGAKQRKKINRKSPTTCSENQKERKSVHWKTIQTESQGRLLAEEEKRQKICKNANKPNTTGIDVPRRPVILAGLGKEKWEPLARCDPSLLVWRNLRQPEKSAQSILKTRWPLDQIRERKTKWLGKKNVALGAGSCSYRKEAAVRYGP